MEASAAQQCQAIIGYTFQDESLLDLALTHASVAPTRLDSNERMEFLGDAVLGLSVCTALYDQLPEELEGEMTKIKSHVVSRRTCAVIVRDLGLCELLSLSGHMGDPNDIPESVAAAIFEAIIGAIYLDAGYEQADRFILEHLQPYIDEAAESSHQQNFKSMLQQHAQRSWSVTPDYVLLDEQGPDHSKCFEVSVECDGRHFPSAWGRSKKAAEQAAAREALIELELVDESTREIDLG